MCHLTFARKVHLVFLLFDFLDSVSELWVMRFDLNFDVGCLEFLNVSGKSDCWSFSSEIDSPSFKGFIENGSVKRVDFSHDQLHIRAGEVRLSTFL